MNVERTDELPISTPKVSPFRGPPSSAKHNLATSSLHSHHICISFPHRPARYLDLSSCSGVARIVFLNRGPTARSGRPSRFEAQRSDMRDVFYLG
ncbi:hypothetical protein PISMIDRAFT_677909 [Pisolithus microcarpus 441]|uniref:Uncharacterized protein n=1 Tax=Pisolithus microcarpus 441 TaxID=765257 RepID=A0A0C9Z6F7_9AGAM|nr:hypothetical protein PISMIDRAFT_677909 [Pisolithus microcarpus 441]